MEEDKREVSLPFLMEHMTHTNKRMYHALLAVCVTFVLTIIIFVFGYTVREKNWLDTLTRLQTQEVQSGIYEQSDSGADR